MADVAKGTLGTFTVPKGTFEASPTSRRAPSGTSTAGPRHQAALGNYTDDRPEWPLSNLRFDLDRERGVAAAVLLALDKAEVSHTWMTRGSAARAGVHLTHDSWNPEDRRFPPESFVTIDQLRDVVRQWAFGDVLPPSAVPWVTVPHESVGWF